MTQQRPEATGAPTLGDPAAATDVASTAVRPAVPARAADAPSSAATPKSGATTAKSASSANAATGGVAQAAKRAPRRRTRKARLRLTRIDPWSVMKTALLFGIAGGIILMVAVWVLWGVIQASGALEAINEQVNNLVTAPGQDARFNIDQYLNTGRVLGLTAMIAAADVVIFTALATLFSFLYNLSATVLGGLEVTLAED